MITLLKLKNKKLVIISGKSFDKDEAHEIIIKLTEAFGTDFEKQELCDMALGIHVEARKG